MYSFLHSSDALNLESTSSSGVSAVVVDCGRSEGKASTVQRCVSVAQADVKYQSWVYHCHFPFHFCEATCMSDSLDYVSLPFPFPTMRPVCQTRLREKVNSDAVLDLRYS